jgi:hypothetical protein
MSETSKAKAETFQAEIQSLKSAASSQPKIDTTELNQLQLDHDNYVLKSEKDLSGLQAEIAELKASLGRFNDDLGRRESSHRDEITVAIRSVNKCSYR